MVSLTSRYALAFAFITVLLLSVLFIETSKNSLSGRVANEAMYVPGDSNVSRVIATTINNGTLVTVSLQINVVKNDYIYAIDETFPLGFTLVNAGSATNVSGRTLKWIYYSNTTLATTHVETYTIQAPQTAGLYNFTGHFQFETTTNNVTENMLGINQTQVVVPEIPPVVGLLSPANNAVLSSRNVSFSCRANDSNNNVRNITLWTNTTGTWAPDITVTGAPSAFITLNRNIAVATYGLFNWTCVACDAGSCSVGPQYVFTLNNVGPSLVLKPASGTISTSGNFTLNCSATDSDGVSDNAFSWDAGLDPYQGSIATQTSGNNRTEWINFTNVPQGTYSWTCNANDTFNLRTFGGGYTIIVDRSPSATYTGLPTQITKPIANGNTVGITLPMSTNNFNGIMNLNFSKPANWTNVSNVTVVEDGVEFVPTVVNSTHFNYTFNSSKAYGLKFFVPPPSFVFVNETANATNYTKYFNISTPNHFTNVSGNTTVNTSYNAFTLYWFDGSNWIDATSQYAFSVSNGMAVFDKISTSDQRFYINGIQTCGNGVCEAVYGEACNVCSDCGTCNVNTPGDRSPGGSPGGSINIPTATLKTDIFNFDKNIYQIEVTYNSTNKINVTLNASTVLTDELNRGVFDVAGTIFLLSGKIRFRVAKEWITEQNIDPKTITLKQYIGGGKWVAKTAVSIGEDAFYQKYETAFVSFGTYAITGAKKQDIPIGPGTELPGLNGTNTTDNSSVIAPPSPGDAMNIVIYVGIILAMVAIIVTFFYISANKKLKSETASKEAAKIEELKKFIAESEKDGFSKEEIRKKLVDAGWNKEIINIYLK